MSFADGMVYFPTFPMADSLRVPRRRCRHFRLPLMTETQERFLRSVLTVVPLDSVVELHLFPPIRRGTMETGVAVIATELPLPPLAILEPEIADQVSADGESAEFALVSTDGQGEESGEVEMEGEGSVLAVVESAAGHDDESADAEEGDDSPYADDVDDADIEGTVADTDVVVMSAPEPEPEIRTRILTASYRHTIKGVDRGKWSFEVQEEADAPLAAVELVLRGVRHRSSEAADPELVQRDVMAALIAPARVAPAA
ncbi:MAG TPA: hypothetical protein VE861_14980 [Gemmatimonadaceae bacterium]|nr:hypothetical protein [Gemmatimonadaceae bacterium]